MKTHFLLALLILIKALQASGIPVEDVRENEIEIDEEDQEDQELEEMWFEQYLNHFDVLDNRTFLMRYFEEATHFKPGGPLLIEIGGEGAIDSKAIKNGQSYLIAKHLNGKLFYLEHRYYGKSSPFDNFTADNLLFLSVEQALEDLAYFVEQMKTNNPELENSKVAVFGCSYPAALATWFRYKFPHLVDAAWASSGPLRAVSDFYEYFEVATEVYRNVSAKCYNTIKTGYEDISYMLDDIEGNARVRSALENWGCGNITEMTDQDILDNIRYVISDHNIPPDHGTATCKFILKKKYARAFERLADWLMSKAETACADDTAEFPNDGLAWTYQTCTEFGYTLTGNSDKQPFNITRDLIDEDIETCVFTFGERFSFEAQQRGIERINRVYGSVGFKATKVLSVHGTQDPWHKLGLYEQTDPERPVILIPGTSHCADQSNDEDEPSQLTKAKSAARKIMIKWLQ